MKETEKGHLAAIAYALYLAVRGEKLKFEGDLQRIVVEYIDNPSDSFQPKRVSKEKEVWKLALRMVTDYGLKKSALIAAYAHALLEQVANHTNEDIKRDHEKGQAKPFGRIARGTIRLPVKRQLNESSRVDS
ncbi:hypothetical protein N8611_02190 [bacterium]|nr:hypothetical protein [bacterium]